MKPLLKLISGIVLALGSAGAMEAAAPCVPFGQYSQQPWDAMSFYSPNNSDKPADDWYLKDFDDSEWTPIQGPLGSSGSAMTYTVTSWDKYYSHYWLRRSFDVADTNDWENVSLVVMHDDGCSVYLNGTLLYSSTDYVTNPITLDLSASQRELLTTGSNVLAVHVNDSRAGQQYIDFGLYSNPWVEVAVDTPGSLGVEILYQVDRLSDITYLRVSGPLNSDDWTTLRNLNNLRGLDLEKAQTNAIPQEAFYNRGNFSYIKLPEEVTTIGASAFYNTHITELYIPASVTSIGNNAFRNTYVENVVFNNECKITSIPEYAFYDCTEMKSIQLPDNGTLRYIERYAFRNCRKLENVNLPESLTSIGDNSFGSTYALSTINFPTSLNYIGSYAFNESGLLSATLPANLSALGSYAFESCNKLEEVYIPSTIHSLNSQFRYCSALQKVICACATPPSVGNDNPFYSVPTGNVTLVTPEFAVADYKLDSYWLRFGKIEGGATSDIWYINAALNLPNGRRMEGTPTVVLQPGAKLQVTGVSPMPMKDFRIQNNYNGTFSYAQLINSSPAMSAAKVEATCNLARQVWIFFSLPFDVKLSDVRHSNPDASFVIRHYDGALRAEKNATGSSWQDLPEDYVLKSGEGYIMMSNVDGEMFFPCADDATATLFNPNARSLELAENSSENAAHAGWNFVANPYPAFYDLYHSMLVCPITIWNHSNRSYQAYSLIDDDVVLYPNQPFFIQASDDVKEIEFGTQGRQFTSAVSRPENISSRSASANGRSLFNLELGCGQRVDNARVVLNEKASEGYEISCDASKFFSDDETMPQLYTFDSEGNSLAINERPEADGLVPVGFYAPEAGLLTLSLSRCDGTAKIYDSLTGEERELTPEQPYTFEVGEGGFNDTRLSLLLAPGSTAGLTDVAAGELEVSVADGVLTVRGCSGKNVAVFSSNGMMIADIRAARDNVSVSLQPGLYIVRAGEKAVKCLVK